MPYGDPEKQKAYLRAYYHKYLKKPNTKKGGNLKIDLWNLKPEPLRDVRNPTLNRYTKPLSFLTKSSLDYSDDFTKDEIIEDELPERSQSARQPIDFLDKRGNLKTTKQIKKEIDERITSKKIKDNSRSPTSKRIKQPSKPLLNSIELYGKDEEEEDEEIEPPKALEYYTDKESYLRNPFLLKIQDEPAFNYQVKQDIPRWISQMTDAKIIKKAEELSNCITDEELDDILNYCNRLFGTHKSRTKREYVLKELSRKCQLSN